MRLQDVVKYQSRRDRPGSGRSRRCNHNEGLNSNNTNASSKKKKKKRSLIRPGASIALASRRHSAETIHLNNDSDEESSVEVVRYQNPPKRAIDADVHSGDESSKESDEEDEIPYKMNFSQPNPKPRKNSDSSDTDNDNDSDDDDDDDFSYESPISRNKGPVEPLRPGDVIEYENTTIFAAGSSMGHNTAKVLGTTPGAKFPLKLSNGEHLDTSIRIRRTHECIKGKLYKHGGYWKPISSFRLRKRLLRNPDGTPVQPDGGVYGQAREFRNLRENLHQKAVEYVRGDHDERIGIEESINGSSKKIASKSSSSSSSSCKATARNRAKANTSDNNNNNDDDGDDSSSSSSSDGSLMRLEFERLSRERQMRQRKRRNQRKHSLSSATASVRKSPPLSLSDSDSDIDITVSLKNKKDSLDMQPSSRTSLLLKRVALSFTSSNNQGNATSSSVSATRPSFEPTKFRTTKAKPIDTSTIEIDTKNNPKKQTRQYNPTDNLSTSSSSSSSSLGNPRSRKSTISKKRGLPPSTNSIAKKKNNKHSNAFLHEDSDSSDDDYLLSNPVFATPRQSLSKPASPTRKSLSESSSPNNSLSKSSSHRNSLSNLQTKPPPATKHDEKKPLSRNPYPSPMEENPLDLFEDSSGEDDDDDSLVLGPTCRKRNRRGERMLSSPSVELRHRKGKEQNAHDWLTQEDSVSERRTGTTLRKESSSSKRTNKRSVVVGYRPLSIAVDGIEQVQSSPPSLAKAYRKREEKLRRQREQQEGDPIAEEQDRDRHKKNGQKKTKERQKTKSVDKGESNRRKLQREKRKLQKQRGKPPPYPPKQSDPNFADMSTQENEWSDVEQDEAESSRHHKRAKKSKKRKKQRSEKMITIAEAPPLEREPTPQKGSTSGNARRSSISTKASQRSINDSEDEEMCSERKRLTPKSRLHKKKRSKSRSAESKNRKETKYKRYELSSSSSESMGVPKQKTPRTPWSTDCEVDSPFPSTIKIVKSNAKESSSNRTDPTRSSKKSKQRKRKQIRNASPSVFEFPSYDENADPSNGSHSNKRPSPNFSKRDISKPRMIILRRAT